MISSWQARGSTVRVKLSIYLAKLKSFSLQANPSIFITKHCRRLLLSDPRASTMPVCATLDGCCIICEYLLFFARTLFHPLLRMMTTFTIMSSFPNRIDLDENYLFGQPSLAACILASIFLSDTSFTTTSFCNMHLWNIVLTCAEE